MAAEVHIIDKQVRQANHNIFPYSEVPISCIKLKVKLACIHCKVVDTSHPDESEDKMFGPLSWRCFSFCMLCRQGNHLGSLLPLHSHENQN